ncbi:MAG: lipoyl(octanoyl) transferase LipB [Actinomycetota bacterium]
MILGRSGWIFAPDLPVPYDDANEWMHGLAERRLADEIPDTLLLLEHPPVFTAGRRAKSEHLIWSAEEASARGADVRHIDRGGSYTFHGPGQLVAYPILDLGTTPDAAAHLRRMEEIVIRAASEIGVALERRPEVQTGVFAGPDKVCAIGVRLLRARISLHGFALNCDTNMDWFAGIIACGLPDNGVTSLSRLAGRPVTVAEMRPLVRRHAADVFGVTFEDAPRGARTAPTTAGTRVSG